MRTGLTHRFARGIAWSLLSGASNQGSTFLVNVVLARLLGERGFGVYAVVLGSIQNLALLAGLAVGYTATRYVAEFRISDPTRAGRVLGSCLLTAGTSAGVGSVALVLIAPQLASRVLSDPALTPLLRLAGVAGFFVIVNGMLMGSLAGLEAFRRLGIANLFAGGLFAAFTLLGARLWGLSGVVIGLVASAIVQTVLLGLALSREARRQGIHITLREPSAERAILFGFALPSAVAGISAASALWLVQLLLARGVHGYAELGFYVAAFNLVSIVLFLPNLANTVATAVLNALGGSGAEHDRRRAFWLNAGVTTLAVGFGALMLALLRSPLMTVYGPAFGVASGVLLLLAIGSIPEALTTAAFQLMQMRERMWQGVRWVILPRDLLFIGFAIHWMPAYGARGVAAAFLLARLVGLALASRLVLSLLQDGTAEEPGNRAHTSG